MAKFKCYLDTEQSTVEPIAGSYFDIQESYNGGWIGEFVLQPNPQSVASLADLLETALRHGLRVGSKVNILMALGDSTPTLPTGEREDDGSLPDGTIVRMWPSVMDSMIPFQDGGTGAPMLLVSFADPVTYLSSRPIYGAYRLTGIAEIIGGGLSLAGGGDGRPTLQPIIDKLPKIKIINDLREELDIIPYCVAAGEPLGAWLGKLEGLLGIRTETSANADAQVQIKLSDRQTSDNHLVMPVTIDDRLLEQDTSSGGVGTPTTNGNLWISSIEARPGAVRRGIVLDDPMLGGFTRIGSQASVGTVVNVSGISADEAGRRLDYELKGIFSEMLILNVRSRQTALRPGRTINTISTMADINIWQVFSVEHTLSQSGAYTNAAKIINSDEASHSGEQASWHPPHALSNAPVIVTAVIDGGDDYIDLEPIPRDRLGRVPITLSFLPTPLEEEAKRLFYADENKDSRITLDDFTEEALSDYDENDSDWRRKAYAYNNGEYADPYPDEEDDDLTPEQLEERTAMRIERENVIRYLASLQARRHDHADRDKDGYISKRDQAISDELSMMLDEAGARAKIREQQQARANGTLDEDYDAEERLSDALLDEFEVLFGRNESGDGEGEAKTSLQLEASAAQDRWPPRIPVTALEPMAGSVHGFIPAHRQGDICRIAVHNPLYIELIGYQYRSDRLINSSVVDVSAGMIVEHNNGPAWSGLVFQRTEDEESEEEPEDQASGG